MGVNTQVSGNKILNIQPSKNNGTVVNTQVSGNKIDRKIGAGNINPKVTTHLSGIRAMTNYMGVNDTGMNIFGTKKVDNTFCSVPYNTAKQNILNAANIEIAAQEAAIKVNNRPTVITLEMESIAVTALPTKVEYDLTTDTFETLDLTGMTVVATFNDGSTDVIETTDLDITIPEITTTGTKTIGVAATVSGITKTTTFDITVVDTTEEPAEE